MPLKKKSSTVHKRSESSSKHRFCHTPVTTHRAKKYHDRTDIPHYIKFSSSTLINTRHENTNENFPRYNFSIRSKEEDDDDDDDGYYFERE
jgi:hypothetical protein